MTRDELERIVKNRPRYYPIFRLTVVTDYLNSYLGEKFEVGDELAYDPNIGSFSAPDKCLRFPTDTEVTPDMAEFVGYRELRDPWMSIQADVPYADMKDEQVTWPRVVIDARPGVCGGRPTIAGTRITAGMLLRHFGDVEGMSIEEAIDGWPSVPAEAWPVLKALGEEMRNPPTTRKEPLR